MRHLLVVLAVTLASAALAACGGDDKPETVTVTTPTPTVATTPAAAKATAAVRVHLDRAVEALRNGIQAPFEKGAFDEGGVDVVLAYAQAAQAASTAVRELGAALEITASEDGLGAVATQIRSLLGHVTTLVGAAQDGDVQPEEIKGLLDDVDALGQTAESAGIELPQSPGVTPGTTTTTP